MLKVASFFDAAHLCVFVIMLQVILVFDNPIGRSITVGPVTVGPVKTRGIQPHNYAYCYYAKNTGCNNNAYHDGREGRIAVAWLVES